MSQKRKKKGTKKKSGNKIEPASIINLVTAILELMTAIILALELFD